MGKNNRKEIKVENEHDDSWYENENIMRSQKAEHDFQDSDVAQLFYENVDSFKRVIAINCNHLLDRSAPIPIRECCHDLQTLRKLLTADTFICYDCWERDEDGEWFEWEDSTESDCSEMQQELCTAIEKYLIIAIALARDFGSPAIDLWAEALDMISFYVADTRHARCGFTETMVDRLFELDANAAKRLRMDMIIKKVPTFNVLRSKSLRKAASANKKSKGKAMLKEWLPPF